MVITNVRTVTPTHWIPPTNSAHYKVTVERTDGTIDDITTKLITMRIKDAATSSIGNFEFQLYNVNNSYGKVWTGMEIVRYYCDYGSATPTTLRFRGRMEKTTKENHKFRGSGRSESVFVFTQIINKEYSGIDAGVIVKDLFDTYGQGRYDTSEINITTGVTLDLSFLDISFWDAIQSTCEAAGYYCHVDAALVVQFKEVGSVVNSEEGIVHGFNLVRVGNFAPDIQQVKNQIKVVGGKVDGVQIWYTSDDTTSQTAYGIREKVYTDSSITTHAAAKEYADFLLSKHKDPPVIGDVTGLLLPSIQPGQKIRLSSPLHDLPPGDYTVIAYETTIGSTGRLLTKVTINKEVKTISQVFKDRIQREFRTSGNAGNPDDLAFSDIELFNSSTGTLSKTEITSGVLQVQSGESSGTWISATYSPGTGATIGSIRLDLVGAALSSIVLEVSTDGGSTYYPATRGTVIAINSGTEITVKATLYSTAQIDSLAVKYSTTT